MVVISTAEEVVIQAVLEIGSLLVMSAVTPKADICTARAMSAFGGKSDTQSASIQTQSGDPFRCSHCLQH